MADVINIDDAPFRITLDELARQLAAANAEEFGDVPHLEWVDVLREVLRDEAEDRAKPEPMSLHQVAIALAREEHAAGKRATDKPFTDEWIRQLQDRAISKCHRWARRNGVKKLEDLLFERDVKLHPGNRRTR